MIRSFRYLIDPVARQDEHRQQGFIVRWPVPPSLLPPVALTFERGLNVIVGPNGCGKSTLLLVLGHYFHAVQAGRTLVTKKSLHKLHDAAGSLRPPERWMMYSHIDALKTVLDVDHDGQGVRYLNPEKIIGLMCNNSIPEEDRVGVDFREAMDNKYCSMGQRTYRNAAASLQAIAGGGVAPIEVSSGAKTAYLETQYGELKNALELLKGSGKKQQPTVLLDEPDRSLDLPAQRDLWTLIRKASKTNQVIVSAHSPFAMDIEGANYVELVPGYLDRMKDAMASLRSA